jgi:hypothetical protein
VFATSLIVGLGLLVFMATGLIGLLYPEDGTPGDGMVLLFAVVPAHALSVLAVMLVSATVTGVVIQADERCRGYTLGSM